LRGESVLINVLFLFKVGVSFIFDILGDACLDFSLKAQKTAVSGKWSCGRRPPENPGRGP
jgi:hypothetical protein